MKKVFSSVLFVLVLALIASTAFAENWFKGSLDEAIAKAKAENKLVLLDFFSGG